MARVNVSHEFAAVYRYLTASGLVTSLPRARLRSVFVSNPTGAAASVVLYDNTSAAGQVVATVHVPAGDCRGMNWDPGLRLSTGLYVTVPAGLLVTVSGKAF